MVIQSCQIVPDYTQRRKSLACTYTGLGMHTHWTWHAHTLDLACTTHWTWHVHILDLACTLTGPGIHTHTRDPACTHIGPGMHKLLSDCQEFGAVRWCRDSYSSTLETHTYTLDMPGNLSLLVCRCFAVCACFHRLCVPVWLELEGCTVTGGLP